MAVKSVTVLNFNVAFIIALAHLLSKIFFSFIIPEVNHFRNYVLYIWHSQVSIDKRK